MLKSLAETVLSFTNAAFARVDTVASSTYCPVVSLPFIRLQPVASRVTAVMAAILREICIRAPREFMSWFLGCLACTQQEQCPSFTGWTPERAAEMAYCSKVIVCSMSYGLLVEMT